ncbi:MAG: DUF1569 domain-containing protein [Bacteroidetes bacterium]|nr:DUF1569 domain-containing protein [Bacteroidota bacterium]
MQTIFNTTTRGELINRINSLNANSKAQWGKMNVYQMLKHCTLWEEMMQSKQNLKRVFLEEWIDRINQYAHFSNPNFEHVFFGKMTEEQIGYMVYKHIDHHLRQFNS